MGFGRGRVRRGGGTTDHQVFPLVACIPRCAVSWSVGLGDGVKPCRGRTEQRTCRERERGRVVMKGWPTADHVAQIARPFICVQIDNLQEGGGGEVALQKCSACYTSQDFYNILHNHSGAAAASTCYRTAVGLQLWQIFPAMRAVSCRRCMHFNFIKLFGLIFLSDIRPVATWSAHLSTAN